MKGLYSAWFGFLAIPGFVNFIRTGENGWLLGGTISLVFAGIYYYWDYKDVLRLNSKEEMF